MKTICLNMIVKDESAVIERCLASVKPYIDSWVIADTGSSDHTPALILAMLQDIPGQLLLRPWVDFAHNRNEVLEASLNQSDYILFIDADERLIDPFDKNQLELDYYQIRLIGKTSEFTKMFLIQNNAGWAWNGVVHESISNDYPVTGEILLNTAIEYDESSGRRSQDPDKYLKDAQILRDALIHDPYNTRYLFYLAQSYAHAKEYQLALETYQERATLGGSSEEIFWSLYCIGCLEEDLGFLPIAAYSRAFQFDKKRAEPLYRLARFLENRPYLSYLVAKHARSIPFPQTAARSQSSIYRELDYKFAEYAYKIGKLDEAKRAYEELLENNPSVEEWITLEENLRKLTFLLSKSDKTGSPLYRPLSAEVSMPLEL